MRFLPRNEYRVSSVEAVVTRSFDIQWQFSRHECLPRKSKVDGALVGVLSRTGRKVRRDKRRRKSKDSVERCSAIHPTLRLTLFSPSFSAFRSLYLHPPFNSFLPPSFSFRFHPLPSLLSHSSGIKLFSSSPRRTSLSPLFTASPYRLAAPYYSSYVNEFRLIIWERSRTENSGNEGVRGLAPERGRRRFRYTVKDCP